MVIRIDKPVASGGSMQPVAAPKTLPPGAQVLTARRGDSLSKVWSESKCGVSWEEFKAANAHIVKAANRDDGNLLAIGDAIVMPAPVASKFRCLG